MHEAVVRCAHPVLTTPPGPHQDPTKPHSTGPIRGPVEGPRVNY